MSAMDVDTPPTSTVAKDKKPRFEVKKVCRVGSARQSSAKMLMGTLRSHRQQQEDLPIPAQTHGWEECICSVLCALC